MLCSDAVLKDTFPNKRDKFQFPIDEVDRRIRQDRHDRGLGDRDRRFAELELSLSLNESGLDWAARSQCRQFPNPPNKAPDFADHSIFQTTSAHDLND